MLDGTAAARAEMSADGLNPRRARFENANETSTIAHNIGNNAFPRQRERREHRTIGRLCHAIALRADTRNQKLALIRHRDALRSDIRRCPNHR
jgi:hypothetical protein